MIYFIGNKEQNICKIGFSGRPYRRIETIQKTVSFKLEIFDIMEGDINKEKCLHAINSEHRLHGEWFKLDKVLELNLVGNLETILIEDFISYIKEGYFYYPSIIVYINSIRIKKGLNYFHFESYFKANKVFIDSFSKKGINAFNGNKFIHPYLAIDLMAAGCNETKLLAYNNLKGFNPNKL